MNAKIYQFKDYQQRSKGKQNTRNLPLWQSIGTACNILLLQTCGWLYIRLCFTFPEHIWIGRIFAIALAFVLVYHALMPLVYYFEKNISKYASYFNAYVLFTTGAGSLFWLMTFNSTDKSVTTYIGLLLGLSFLLFNGVLLYKWNKIISSETEAA